jgi:hypothetical protein
MAIFLGAADHVVIYLQELVDEFLSLQFADFLKVVAYGIKDVEIIV